MLSLRFLPLSLVGTVAVFVCMFLPAFTVTSNSVFTTDHEIHQYSLYHALTSDFPSDGFQDDDLWIVIVMAGAAASVLMPICGLVVFAGAMRLFEITEWNVIDATRSEPAIALYLIAAASVIILLGPLVSVESAGGVKVVFVKDLKEYLRRLGSIGIKVWSPA